MGNGSVTQCGAFLWFYSCIWLLSSKINFLFDKSKTNNRKNGGSHFTTTFFLRGSKNPGAMFLSAQNSSSVGKIFSWTISFSSLCLILSVSCCLTMSCSFIKRRTTIAYFPKKHYQLIRFTQITSEAAQRRKLIFRHNKPKIFCVLVWSIFGKRMAVLQSEATAFSVRELVSFYNSS